MKKTLSRIYQTFLSPALDLRVRMFNILTTAGILVSLITAVSAYINGENFINILIYLFAGTFAIVLLVYSSRSGKYQLCYVVSIVLVFFILFPFIFFFGGGIDSAMPFYFIFAILFTISLLNGKKALFMALIELTVYIGLFFIEWSFPSMITPLPSPQAIIFDKIIGLAAVSIALGTTMFLHFRLYNEQQRRLDEQNVLLAQINRSKTEFLADTSHEMRTPLTVISVNVQMVSGILKHMGEVALDPKAGELLTDAQSEIMRLARMVGGMLTLASISENTEKSRIDLTALLQSTTDMLRLLISKRGNEFETEIGEGLVVFGDADLLSQIAVNLIQNAHAHTADDTIRLCAVRNGGTITITVSDNGSGIPQDLLPRVFERGVSGKDGDGTGFGLFLCKTVVESHGGEIWIESEQGKGTTVYFTLPVYEGQYGGGTV